MKINYDCYPCFLRQGLNAARRSQASNEQTFEVLQQALKALLNLNIDTTPPEIGLVVHQVARTITGNDDPYKPDKDLTTQQALEMYPRLKSLVENSSDPLDTAIRLSIAGNIIDLGVGDSIGDIWQTVERVLQQPYAIDDTFILRQKLDSAPFLLYLADNAGESVFDRVLIETLPLPVVYGVKGEPVINDVTMEDAIAAGLDRCATLLSNGCGAPGTVLSLCSAEFIEQYEKAPLVIAKGQGNYESLSDAGEKVFCLLQAKCPVIGQFLDVPVGSIIVRQSNDS